MKKGITLLLFLCFCLTGVSQSYTCSENGSEKVIEMNETDHSGNLIKVIENENCILSTMVNNRISKSEIVELFGDEFYFSESKRVVYEVKIGIHGQCLLYLNFKKNRLKKYSVEVINY